jgi:DNA mismatch endonuclease (patch repair protein)
MDRFSGEKRSEIMSKIRSENTVPEIILKKALKEQRIKFTQHPDLQGHPDFLVNDLNLCIFVHGCFWHGCKRHFRMPKSNRPFWKSKIGSNIERHDRNAKILKSLGYGVMVIWEHDLR